MCGPMSWQQPPLLLLLGGLSLLRGEKAGLPCTVGMVVAFAPVLWNVTKR